MDIPNRDTLHMFKKGIKPRWEDPRNKDGGTQIYFPPSFSPGQLGMVGGLTFRVTQIQSKEVFQYILLLLIGEILTPDLAESIKSGNMIDVDDDICGVSLSARAFSNLITIWNRVAPKTTSCDEIPQKLHQAGDALDIERGVERMKEAVLRGIREEVRPQTVYYRVSDVLLLVG